jgi:hypothetical protein
MSSSRAILSLSTSQEQSMKYVQAGFIAASLLTMVSSATFAQSGPSGAWDLTIDSPQGANTVTLTLKQDGDKLTGDMSSQMGTTPVAGTFSGGTVAVTANIDLQGTSLQLGINGKLAADALSGTVKFGDFGEFPFTGKRAAAGGTSAAAPPAAAPASPAAAAPVAAASVAGSDITGKWDVILMVPGAGEVPATADFKQAGTAVTGTFSTPAGDVPVSGTMTGALLKLEFKAETPQGPLTITMTGDLGANGFTGKASLAGMGEADWKATRGK